MTAVAVVSLAAYAAAFQNLVYLSVPAGRRVRVVPLVTGAVGVAVIVGSGLALGFDRIGLFGGNPLIVLAWGLGSALMVSIVGLAMLRTRTLRPQLADPRIAAMGGREAVAHVLIRIPILTALIEEAFFRGLLHAALTAVYPVDAAMLIGAGLFGLWHIGPGIDQAQAAGKPTVAKAMHTLLTVIATSMAGLALIWLRVKTGSIWAPVAVHAAVNMTLAVFSRLASDHSTARFQDLATVNGSGD